MRWCDIRRGVTFKTMLTFFCIGLIISLGNILKEKQEKRQKRSWYVHFFHFCKIMLFTKLDSSGHLLLYSNLSIGLNGEINYKFVSLCLWLLVLVWDSYLRLSSFPSGKRTGNKRILESTSKENFKVCDQLYLSSAPKHNGKRTQLKQTTNTKRSWYSFRVYPNLFWKRSFLHLHVVSETKNGPKCKDCYPSGVRELKMSKMCEEKEWPGTWWIGHTPLALFPQCNHVNVIYVLQAQVVHGYKTLRQRNVFAKEWKYQYKVWEEYSSRPFA